MVKSITALAILASLSIAASTSEGGTVTIRVKKPNGTAGSGLKVDISEIANGAAIDSGTTNKQGEFSTKKILAGTDCVHIDIFIKFRPRGKTKAEWSPLCRDDRKVSPIIEITPRLNAQLEAPRGAYVLAWVPTRTACGPSWCLECGEIDPADDDSKELSAPKTEDGSSSPDIRFGDALFASRCPLDTVPQPEIPSVRKTRNDRLRGWVGFPPHDAGTPERIRIPFPDEPQSHPLPVANYDRP